MPHAEPITVVNIVSVSYSGSTWANLVIGSHPQAFSCGEMDRIYDADRVVCRMHGEQCPVWSAFDPKSQENPFRQLAGITARRVFVVNNVAKLLEHQGKGGVRSKFVFLVRDGRAVAASAMRKYPQQSTWKASRFWATTIGKKRTFIAAQDPADVVTVQYERFVADIAGEGRRICATLGLDYDDQMSRYWAPDHCFVGGNAGALFAITRREPGRELHRAKNPPSMVRMTLLPPLRSARAVNQSPPAASSLPSPPPITRNANSAKDSTNSDKPTLI